MQKGARDYYSSVTPLKFGKARGWSLKLHRHRAGQPHAAALSSLSALRATIFNAWSGNGRCSAFASSYGAQHIIYR
jgi:hypothetical protein